MEIKDDAARVRAAYFRAYNYFNNCGDQTYGSSKIEHWDKSDSNKSIWNTVARRLKNKNITNVERFVRAQFSCRTNKKIYPTHLLASSAFENYEEFDQFADRELEFQLRNDISKFKEDFKTKKDCKSVLLDLENEISPLFRFIVALSENIPDLSNKFKEAARLQFLLDPIGYLRVWGKLLPAEYFYSLLSEIERQYYVL